MLLPAANMATQAGHDSAYTSSPARDDDELSDSSTYECNICYELAREPVVTMCGHLYCWPCLYRYVTPSSAFLCGTAASDASFLVGGCRFRTCAKSVLSAKQE